MRIEENKLAHWIDHFYGYGSWSARTWFIAHEDSGGDLPEEVAEKINYFYHAQPTVTEPELCSLHEFYKHMSFIADESKAAAYNNLYDFRFGTKAVSNTIWKNLVSFAHGFRNEPLPDLLQYQKDKLAQAALHNEALLRLYPLPAANHHAWYYGWLEVPQLPFLKSREQYEKHVYEKRMSTFLHNIQTYKPEVVVMYGMNNINKLKQSVQQFFSSTDFKAVKAVKQSIPQHHRARIGATTLVITTQLPTLRHHRVETGFDWEAFGKAVKG